MPNLLTCKHLLEEVETITLKSTAWGKKVEDPGKQSMLQKKEEQHLRC